MKPVSDGGKKDSPRTSRNVKRQYSEGFDCIDFSLDAQGKPRMNHDNTLAFGDDPEAPLLQPVALDD